jgi:hypothetical protein
MKRKAALALLGGDGNMVDRVAVEIGDLASVSRELLELCNGSNADNFLVVL